MFSIYWAPSEPSLGKKWKRRMVARKGGRCLKCGYDKCPQALGFHHINPADKKYEITRGGGKTYLGEKPSPEELENEIETKCICLCHNCHAEVEAGLWSIQDLVQVALLTGVTIKAPPIRFSLS